LKSSRKSSVKLPARNDEIGWLKFCYGIEESLNLVKFKGLENEGNVEKMTLPFVSVVSKIDQVQTRFCNLFFKKEKKNFFFFS
jgi:hypothetical protein